MMDSTNKNVTKSKMVVTFCMTEELLVQSKRHFSRCETTFSSAKIWLVGIVSRPTMCISALKHI